MIKGQGTYSRLKYESRRSPCTAGSRDRDRRQDSHINYHSSRVPEAEDV